MRTLFISDVHLGSAFSQPTRLLAYLNDVKHNDMPTKIYLVGDFIDGWKLQRNKMRNWGNAETLVIRKLLSLVKHGVEVVYVAGNHDEFLRAFLSDYDGGFGNIRFVDEDIHVTADGRRLLIIHGDQFDVSLRYARWLAVLGDIGYELLLRVNFVFNFMQRMLSGGRVEKWSLSQQVKQHVKKAVNVIGDFEECLVRYAEKHKCDGVVCGHIHMAEAKQLDGVWYYNTGDWVETCSSLVESDSGDMQLCFPYVGRGTEVLVANK